MNWHVVNVKNKKGVVVIQNPRNRCVHPWLCTILDNSRTVQLLNRNHFVGQFFSYRNNVSEDNKFTLREDYKFMSDRNVIGEKN